jgi:hypothetical protein
MTKVVRRIPARSSGRGAIGFMMMKFRFAAAKVRLFHQIITKTYNFGKMIIFAAGICR